MAVAYFDCFAGAAGDMMVASLLDAGADFDSLAGELAKLGAAGYSLSADRVQRGGISGTKFDVRLADAGPAGPADHTDHADSAGHHDHHGQPTRRLDDILEMIAAAGLARRVADRAERIFRALAEAEGRVHGLDARQVHFHEVGAIDSIMDIVGVCIALELLGVDRVFSSAVPLGSGMIDSAHGPLPVPAPATAGLLVGAKISAAPVAGEATTPTAAAVLSALAENFGPMPAMAVSAVGYGAGTRDQAGVPNLLRVFVGEPDLAGEADTVVELSANVDDCTGEIIGAAIDKLLSAGCLDAWATPIFMKKSRPAWMLSALCHYGDADRAREIIFAETTSFGVRSRPVDRAKLLRVHKTVETRYGPIRVKIGRRDGTELTASPEFSDCRSAAEAHHVAVRDVLVAARQAYTTQGDCT